MAKINEKEIKDLMETLELTREEALELLSFDKGETESEEVEKIEKKVKTETEKPKKKGSSLDKVKLQKAKKKEDKTKDEILKAIEQFMDKSEIMLNVQALTTSKFTFKDKDGNYCSISLTKHKAKPDGYHEEE